MDYVALRQLVQCRECVGQQLQSLVFAGGFADGLNDITSSFVLVAVEVTLGSVGSDSLDCGLMICHFC